MKLVRIGIVTVGGLGVARADLPIHGLMNDVLGTWKFTIGADGSDHPTSCGSGAPNFNLENLRPALSNYASWLASQSPVETEVELSLTDKLIRKNSDMAPRNNWKYLAVTLPSKPDVPVGTWTMVYDEGFEVRLPTRRFFGFLKYSRKNGKECPRRLNGDNEDSFGETRCYVTDPSKIHMGWTVEESKDQHQLKHTWGCFYGEKTRKEEREESIPAVVLENTAYQLPTMPSLSSLTDGISPPKTWTPTVHRQFANASPRDLSLYKGQLGFRKYHPLVEYALPTFLQKDRTGSKQQRIICNAAETVLERRSKPPKQWTWGDPFLSKSWKPETDPVVNQGACGSCYAVSSAYILQKRFEIMFSKLFPGENTTVFESPLSAQSILSCSPYNQGCDGGYPFLVGKHAKEFGFGTEQCQRYSASHDPQVASCQMNIGSVNRTPEHSAPGCGPDDRWYAKDYNYVGGFYEGCNEEKMMNEMYHHGPVVVAIDAPDTLFMYQSGLFDSQPSEHGKICDIPKKGFNGWEYTNHAVAVVGWGEDEPDNATGKPKKFWVVRNTWGSNWGTHGYVKIPRGENMAAIESQAVYFDPDLTRGRAAQLIKQYRKQREA
ncbi:putative preprocathepsin c precursor [Toxoplasma gondii VAND]|uniref:Dipeptidyl peptidase 1 n=2 Tax=Toxoplasma gondii TaxID=5811 RepID=V4ZHR9_TOXGV|nr:putative preprocathepsin c precursor [Toxoplasma gondii VEG]KFH01723.1 putative preprocathepsin c precursor [Toxoplasma gondii VAND]